MTVDSGIGGPSGDPVVPDIDPTAPDDERDRRRIDWMLIGGMSGLVVLAVMAVVGPLIWSADPNATDLSVTLRPPSSEHPMGTDENGRDILARFMAGARLSLVVGCVASVVGAVIGGILGLIAGVRDGVLSTALLRAMDSILAFPPLVLAMAVTVALGASVFTASIGIVVTSVPYFMRLIRSEVLRIRSSVFVEASYTLGASKTRTAVRHVAPHTVATLLVQLASNFGYAINTLAALSFIGLGAQIPTAEWGLMITTGLSYSLTGEWWLAFFPGVGLLIAITSAGLLADRIRTLADPRRIYR